MTIRVAINGFGRIGRLVLRAFAEYYHDTITVVAINNPSPIETAQHLFCYDSVHGRYKNSVSYDENFLDIGFGKMRYTRFRNPEEAEWEKVNADIVLECSGHLNSKEASSLHLKAGAKKVLVSAPCKDADITIVYGVNHHSLQKEHTIISNASCTTNCFAPVVKLLQDHFGISEGYMTTVHAYTGDQNLVDNSHKDLRRARCAPMSIVPTSTGAAKALGEVIPALKGKLDGYAMRVPTANVSCVDFSCTINKKTTTEEIHHIFKEASMHQMKNIVAINTLPLVSIDFNGHSASSIIDLAYTKVLNEKFVKVLAWYDNEWGFSCRMLDNVIEIKKYI